MTFSFQLNGHAGEGMQSNRQQEIDAVQSLIRDVLLAARQRGLNASISDVNPSDWAPDEPMTSFH